MSEGKKSGLADVEHAAREVAGTLSLEIVEFVFHSRGKHSQLRIDIDRPGLPGAGLADCEALSRALDDVLEGLDFFGDAYELQVSTPGIDRPIRTDDDIRRNTARPVRADVGDETGRVREIFGTLAGIDPDGAVLIAAEGGEIAVPRERIVLMKQDVAVGRRRGKRRS
jgi:ribosome maturation factor RimP